MVPKHEYNIKIVCDHCSGSTPVKLRLTPKQAIVLYELAEAADEASDPDVDVTATCYLEIKKTSINV